MSDQVTRDNHYVPQWYQRGFLEQGQSKLHYLDMAPARKMLPGGGTILLNGLQRRAPRSCFNEHDLYSTHFGTFVNDEIEKFLFGSIDDRGSNAVRAFADGEVSAMHYAFEDFFEYLDAQKLRTPKGLDWIKSHYPSLNQVRLMVEMQALRLMHCTIWTEGVREIVSARDSDVKFIITDHPVTVYNAATPPTSSECAYPQDPSIGWIGTITVFVLDANTCLILSNLEYAQSKKTADLTAARTNARYRGQSIVRTDAFIRTRKLLRHEVICINHLLKSRARRYVAASNKDWLFPERSFTGSWQDIATVLLPKDELWQFGGELYVGYKDGSTHYQDAFGRTSKSHQYLKRKQPNLAPGPNDVCGCGSGRKFKKCCQEVPEVNRPTWDIYSIRERNLMLIRAVQDILDLESGKTWEDVRRDISDQEIKSIHEFFAGLWPADTDLSELLPRPRNGVFRAIYLGPCDPRTVQVTALSWLPYFDEIILPHPFMNPNGTSPEYSPTKSAYQHKMQTLKNVFLLLVLEPFIQAGLVHLIPDPGDFNPQFGRSVLKMAEQRTTGWEPDRKSLSQLDVLAKDDFRRLLHQLPEDSLRACILEHFPEATESTLRAVMERIKAEVIADPYTPLQPLRPEETGGQLIYIKGYSLETAMYLSSLTGSCIYTDMEAQWQQLHMHPVYGALMANNAWTPVRESLRSINFPVELNTNTVLHGLNNGRFGCIRPLLRRLVESVHGPVTPTRVTHLALQIIDGAKGIQHEWAKIPNTSRLAGSMELSVPLGGFERDDVHRLLLTFGRTKTVRPVPLAMLIRLDTSVSVASGGFESAN